jgi:TolB protein
MLKFRESNKENVVYKFLLCFCLLSVSIFAVQDEFTILLDTESKLTPVLIPHVYDDSGFDVGYINKVENIINFDFRNNGMTHVLGLSDRDQDKASQEGFEGLKYRPEWREQGVVYVIKFGVADKTMTAKIFDVKEGTVRTTHDIQLSGRLGEDRRKIHQLSDAIFKALFDFDGIASTKVLYTITKGRTTSKNQKISEVWQCDYDGSNKHQITNDGFYSVSPVYIPTREGYASNNFLYVSYRNGQPKIYMSSLRGGSGRRAVQITGNQFHPVVSLKQDMIAFISDVGGNPDLYIQPFKNGPVGKPRQIFSSSGAQGSPTFSPDEKKIAFVSNKDGPARIYVMDIPSPGTRPDRVRPILLTRRNQGNTSPAWSPDGTKLAYSAITKSIRQIWIYDFETGTETQLTTGNINKENPSWAPDSLHVVFNTGDLYSCELYITNLNNPVATCITSGPGEKRFPSWEPRS